jgi:hypothetical protein
MFFLIWERELQIQIKALSYIYIYNMLPKVGLLEETKRGGKEKEWQRVNNIEIYHTCVGIGTTKCTENY